MEAWKQKYLNKIVQGDCLEIMREIPDDSVDMTFADPPYNLGKKYEHYEDNKETREYLAWCREWLHEMVRITRSSGSIFVINIPLWAIYFAQYLSEVAYFKAWIAWDAMAAPRGRKLLPNHYAILWFVKDPKRYKFYDIRYPHPRCRVCGELIADYGGKKHLLHPFGPLVSDVWTDIHRIRHKVRRDEHPCQLPVPLLERLILMATDEGDIVLDPFVGTGTTCVAAKRLGRQYIGIDIDPKYVEIARRNVQKAKPTLINGVYVSVYLDRIMTIRDKDYDKIKEFLTTKPLIVNSKTVKQMTLPVFQEKDED